MSPVINTVRNNQTKFRTSAVNQQFKAYFEVFIKEKYLKIARITEYQIAIMLSCQHRDNL